MTPVERAEIQIYILDRINVVSECWIWKNRLTKTGYGYSIAYETITTLMHRLAFIVFKGVIIGGSRVKHHCGNKACCNPDHLYIKKLGKL